MGDQEGEWPQVGIRCCFRGGRDGGEEGEGGGSVRGGSEKLRDLLFFFKGHESNIVLGYTTFMYRKIPKVDVDSLLHLMGSIWSVI